MMRSNKKLKNKKRNKYKKHQFKGISISIGS